MFILNNMSIHTSMYIQYTYTQTYTYLKSKMFAHKTYKDFKCSHTHSYIQTHIQGRKEILKRRGARLRGQGGEY